MGKSYAMALLLAAAATPVLATPPLPSPDDPIMERSRDIIENNLGRDVPAWATPEITDQQRAWAKKIMEQTHLQLRNGDLIETVDKALPGDQSLPEKVAKAMAETKQSQSGSDDEPGYVIRVFTTLGEGGNGMARFKAQLRTLASFPNVEVLIQGLPEDMTYINEMIRTLGRIAHDFKEATGQPPPPIKLAPMAFRKAGVETAPTVVYYRDGKPVARIRGSLEIGYLKAHVADGDTGELGVRGPVYAVAEVNLMTVIKRRLANFDWAAAKDRAIKHYWASYVPPTLPTADEPRTLRIDPTIVVARDIRTLKGVLVARKGQRINPLDKLPFTGQIIAFDGDDPEQVKLAGLLADKAREQGLRPILLTQGLPGEHPGFDAIDKLRKQVGGRIYLLKPNVISRFRIQALPATVKSAGQVFVLRELVPDQALVRLTQE